MNDDQLSPSVNTPKETTWQLVSNLSRRSDACAGETTQGQSRPRAGRQIEIKREAKRGGLGELISW
uniref:Uncharacterized protein n=1 Tax=Zea mays TaxID=4577 RepID=C0PLN1_MAIZE|nr:unknown [Zea mays]